MHTYLHKKVIFLWYKNTVIFISAISRAIKLNREGGDGWTKNGDEEINAAEEAAAKVAKVVSIPSKLKAVIKFGYDEGIKTRLGTQSFESYIEGVFTHTQVHFKDASLGTEIHFEVCVI